VGVEGLALNKTRHRTWKQRQRSLLLSASPDSAHLLGVVAGRRFAVESVIRRVCCYTLPSLSAGRAVPARERRRSHDGIVSVL